jgi:hypothetical protein
LWQEGQLALLLVRVDYRRLTTEHVALETGILEGSSWVNILVAQGCPLVEQIRSAMNYDNAVQVDGQSAESAFH